MDVTQVTAKLTAMNQTLATNAVDSPLFQQTGKAMDQMLYQNMSIKEYTFIGQHLGRPMTVTDEAKLIVAAANGESLPDAVGLPASAKAAFLVRHGRQQAGMSQEDLAVAVGMSQSQIARIENVTSGINLDLLQRVLNVLGETFIMTPNKLA